MARCAQALLNVALCGAGLLAAPALAQAPALPVTTASTTAAVASSPRALPRELPLRRDEPASPAPLSLSWLTGALLLALLAAGGFAVVRRRGGSWPAAWKPVPNAGGPIRRLSSQALTPQASVHAIQWSGEELLLACTAQQVTVLARRPLPPQGESA